MCVDANVSFSSARIIVRHLNSIFKNCIQVPFSRIQQLGDISSRIQPEFKEFIYRKDGDEKIGEKIKYWHYNILNLLIEDFERLLQSDCDSQLSYGYESKAFEKNKKGVFVIMGADHGGGKSRYLVRTNLLHSKSRREQNNKADYGTRTLQFCEVDCKKDVCVVQQKIAPIINAAKIDIEGSMLVAVKNGRGEIRCIFLPKSSSDIHTCIKLGHLYLVYTHNGKNEEKSVHLSPTGVSSAWIFIPSFKMIVAGDLSFFATCTGRDGRSHCRCTYCHLSPSECKNNQMSHLPTHLVY